MDHVYILCVCVDHNVHMDYMEYIGYILYLDATIVHMDFPKL